MALLTFVLANWRVVAALGLAVALAGAGWWIDSRAYQRGATATTATWQAREIRELATANAEILRLQAEVANKERQAAESIAALGGLHQEELNHVQAERARFMDDLAAGRVRFYVPGTTARPAACSSAAADPAAAAGRGDGEARTELPEPVTRFLYGEASRADEVVAQLALAQGVIERYLEACR